MEAMLTVDDVAKRLKISRSTVYNVIESGELPHHRFGRGRGTIRVSEEQLNRFLGETKMERVPAGSVPLRDIPYRGPSR